MTKIQIKLRKNQVHIELVSLQLLHKEYFEQNERKV